MPEPSNPLPGTAAASRQRAWLSFGVSQLFDRHERRRRQWGQTAGLAPHFDVLIVGSGYGGAIAAASLAGCRLPNKRRLRIAVLERGQEYLPGAFPSELSDLPRHVRVSLPDATSPNGPRSGLFDVRVAADVVTVVANGLGGGSLINAGVMLRPKDAVFKEARWPAKIRLAHKPLDAFYPRVLQWLGATAPGGRPNTVDPKRAPTKFRVMKSIGGEAVPITVALRAGARSSAGVALNKCVDCGDCATGCNHGAKDSLDVNLLVF
jgi:cholesterol oxidase